MKQLKKQLNALLALEKKAELAQHQDKSREMKNRRRRGKDAERKIAKDIGGKRRGGVGQEDVNAGMFSIETKHTKRFASRMEKGLDEAFRHKGQEQMAIYVEKCGREARVYLNWRDWLDLHGRA